jgi:hypothetical protein
MADGKVTACGSHYRHEGRSVRAADIQCYAALAAPGTYKYDDEERGENGSDGYIPMRQLASTLHNDFQLVSEMSDKLQSFGLVKTEVLLLGGSKSPAYLQVALDNLEKVLPNAKRVEFARLGHAAAWNSDRGGKPEVVVQALRVFLPDHKISSIILHLVLGRFVCKVGSSSQEEELFSPRLNQESASSLALRPRASLRLSKFFFILQWCFPQHLLEIRDEMLLTAVSKVVGNHCPIKFIRLADLLGGRKKPMTLDQPFEPNAKVILKELLQPAFTSAKRFCHGINRPEAFIGFDGGNDFIDELEIDIRLGTFRTKRGDSGFVTASVIDPFGNILGIMYNPHYVQVLGSRTA